MENGVPPQILQSRPWERSTIIQLDGYDIIGELGKGGMGRVALAVRSGQGGFERLFAIKMLHEDMLEEPTALLMLLDEANIASRLHHANIVPIVDIGPCSSGYYLVMEYIEGCSLFELLRKSRNDRPARLVIPIILDALRGLHAAHQMADPTGAPLSLVHRDFSPHNLLVGLDGTCRVTDFGIAKIAVRLTQTSGNTNKGKLSYMSPEQLSSAKDIDRRADIWAAGVVLYSALTAEHPLRGDCEASTVMNILRRNIPAASKVGLKPPRCVDKVCAKALQRRRSRRFQTAEEMSDAIHSIAIKHDLLGTPSEIAAWVKESARAQIDARRAVLRSYRQMKSPGPLTPLPHPLTPLPHPLTPHPLTPLPYPLTPTPRGVTPLTPHPLTPLPYPLTPTPQGITPFGLTPPQGISYQTSVTQQDQTSSVEATPPVQLVAPSCFHRGEMLDSVDEASEDMPATALDVFLNASSTPKGHRFHLRKVLVIAVAPICILCVVFLLMLATVRAEPSGETHLIVATATSAEEHGGGDSSAETDRSATSEANPSQSSREPGGELSGLTVTLTGIPNEALIKLDGQRVGQKRFFVPRDGRRHELTVDAKGYRRWSRAIEAETDEALEISLRRWFRENELESSQTPRPKLFRQPGF